VWQILGIQKVHTAMFKITNEQTRMHFCNIPYIGEITTKRQLQWIGRIAKMKEDRAPRKLVSSWIANPRKSGRPQINYRNTYAEALSTIVAECNPIVGSNKTWMPIAARAFGTTRLNNGGARKYTRQMKYLYRYR
jgi:hypothetical protein